MNDGYIRSHVAIGRFCSIGRRVTIAAGHHFTERLTTSPIAATARSNKVSMPPANKGAAQATIIGHDVFIGDGVVIQPGLTIGTGAVIGSNAVVAKNVPPYAIVGGVPARIIRYRFDEATIAALLTSEWWLIELEKLKELEMNNIPSCLENIEAFKAAALRPIAYTTV